MTELRDFRPQADDPWHVRILSKAHWGAHPAGLDNLFPDDPRISVMHHFLGSWKVRRRQQREAWSWARFCWTLLSSCTPGCHPWIRDHSGATAQQGAFYLLSSTTVYPSMSVLLAAGARRVAQAPRQHRRACPPIQRLAAPTVSEASSQHLSIPSCTAVELSIPSNVLHARDVRPPSCRSTPSARCCPHINGESA